MPLTHCSEMDYYSNSPVAAEWGKLQALQRRYDALAALLPSGDVDELVNLDAATLDSTLANIELVSAEMLRVSAAERAILEGLLAAAPADRHG
jgi:hypothetical protein